MEKAHGLGRENVLKVCKQIPHLVSRQVRFWHRVRLQNRLWWLLKSQSPLHPAPSRSLGDKPRCSWSLLFPQAPVGPWPARSLASLAWLRLVLRAKLLLGWRAAWLLGWCRLCPAHGASSAQVWPLFPSRLVSKLCVVWYWALVKR